MSVVQADAFAYLTGLPDRSVDLCVTDPPYESLEKHRAVGTTTRLKVSAGSSNEWFPIMPNGKFLDLFMHLYRVLKNDSHLYLFSDAETMFIAKPMAEAVGFKFWKPLIWDYGAIGMGYHYRARHQFILFFEKGKRRLNDLGVPDVFNVPKVRNGYPTEKPVDVSKILISQSTDLGALVMDPFCGSGSVGVAAQQLGRRFIGCDIKQNAVDLANSRLQPVIKSRLAT